jgi:lipopolysaccharide/colanic/teichoic acid biosynthesis glycosyltransferase
MDRGWWYRIVSLSGIVVVTILTVILTNLPAMHAAFDRVPYFGRPAPEVLPADDLTLAVTTTVAVVSAVMWPLFKPQPRRLLDTILLTQKRVLFAMVGLAALGYFNYSYRLPRTTLMLTTTVLFLALPAFMILVRRRPRTTSRAVIVGDHPDTMRALLSATEAPVIGYISPPSVYESREPAHETVPVSLADGGQANEDLSALSCLGGLARLEDVFVEYDIDTALLAFTWTDREEFFGTLETCHDHGVNAFVHREYADHVLTNDYAGEELLGVDLEPWDWQDYVLKRAFDVAFAAGTLLFMSPLLAIIGLAIKLQDGGPILYRQERTAEFGRMFTIYKFRSMTPDDEDTSPDSEEDYRVTRVGRVLRKTHLDEIPQLWTILTGKMSVVGPRAVWTEEEIHLEEETAAWRKRWFIKPGLTGVAQINDATSADAKAKLRYDLEYIRRQSFWFDLRIVICQLWKAGRDAVGFVVGEDSEDDVARRGDNIDGEGTDIVEDSDTEAVAVDADDAHRE